MPIDMLQMIFFHTAAISPRTSKNKSWKTENTGKAVCI